jgi:hypothetical protein
MPPMTSLFVSAAMGLRAAASFNNIKMHLLLMVKEALS